MTNFFEIVGLPTAFSLDAKELDRRYHELSRAVHPDRLAAAPTHDRRAALERSAALNEAYRTLKDPQRRAAHFFELHGLSLDAEGRNAIAVGPEFLGAFLEVRERFEEHAANPTARAETRDSMQREREQRLRHLTADLSSLAPGVSREALLPLAQRLLELRYYERFLEELEEDSP